jgi:hypothetical protein
MKIIRILFLFILFSSSVFGFAQAVGSYPCEQLTVDSIQSSKNNPTQIQLTVTNHDTSLTWGPTFFGLTSLSGDTIATDITCGCVVVLRGRTGIFNFNAKDTSFRVPPNFCCNLTLTGSGVVCKKSYGSCTVTGEATVVAGKPAVSIFPNPAQQEMTLDLGVEPVDPTIIYFSNLQGRRLGSETIISQRTGLNISNLDAGVYLLEIYSNGLLTGTKKVIKARAH